MYKIKMSEHVKNIIRKDSTNVKLGLVVSSDISSSMNTEVANSDLMTYHHLHRLQLTLWELF